MCGAKLEGRGLEAVIEPEVAKQRTVREELGAVAPERGLVHAHCGRAEWRPIADGGAVVEGTRAQRIPGHSETRVVHHSQKELRGRIPVRLPLADRPENFRGALVVTAR